jgi:hypothetical protein
MQVDRIKSNFEDATTQRWAKRTSALRTFISQSPCSRNAIASPLDRVKELQAPCFSLVDSRAKARNCVLRVAALEARLRESCG